MKKEFDEKDAFNYLLSEQRAFGILVARFGIFWHPLRLKMVIRVCAKLHNIVSIETLRSQILNFITIIMPTILIASLVMT